MAIGVWLYALFDSVTCPVDQIRGLQKPLWVLIVLFFNVFGAVAWFLFGRPRTGLTSALRLGGGVGGSTSRRGGSIAPDDDIDFLRSLNDPRRDGNGPAKS